MTTSDDFTAHRSTMLLPVNLTDADRLNIQGDLTRAITAQEEAEEEKREANRGFNETIKGHKATVHRLNESLKLGYAEREVEVEERPGPGATVEIWRLDTNEIVKNRKLDDEERQLTLLDGGAPKPATDWTTEEQQAETPEEAEEMRRQRLEREHAERRDGLVEAVKGSITCTPQIAGGYLAQHGDLREVGETEDEAREKVLALYVATLPEFEVPPAPTWEQIKADRAEEQRKEEIAALAADQQADDTATKKRMLKAPTKGPKPKTAKRMGVIDAATGKDLLAEDAAPAEEAPPAETDMAIDDDQPLDADGKPVAF